MTIKNSLITAATLFAVAAPSLALADGFHVSAGVSLPPVSVHVHGSDCHHGPPPSPPPQPTGHYELRTVSEQLPGRYEQVWVPASCVNQYRGRWGRHVRQVCNPGYYTQQWVPGGYVQTQKYVFVNDTQPVYQYGDNYTDGQYYGGGYAGQR